MVLDVIYPLHNRLDYVKMTLPRVIHECLMWHKDELKLWVYDDNSTDGSSELVRELLDKNDLDYHYERGPIGNSTYCINETLRKGAATYLYKIDNDIIIPLGSFDYMLTRMIENPQCGFMMMNETGDYPRIFSDEIVNADRSHIGGVGIFRREAFAGPIRTNGRFFGFTNYQIQTKKRGWLCMEADAQNTNLDSSEWYSRAKEYQRKGWGRILNNVTSVWQM